MTENQSAAPAEPDWSKFYKTQVDRETAHALWESTVAEMTGASTLALVNGPAIRRYVIFQVEFERQARALGKAGVVKKAPRTKVAMIGPGWTVMKQAAEAAGSLEAELGISPRRRKNVGTVGRKETRTSRADAFLAPRQQNHLRSVP